MGHRRAVVAPGPAAAEGALPASRPRSDGGWALASKGIPAGRGRAVPSIRDHFAPNPVISLPSATQSPSPEVTALQGCDGVSTEDGCSHIRLPSPSAWP